MGQLFPPCWPRVLLRLASPSLPPTSALLVSTMESWLQEHMLPPMPPMLMLSLPMELPSQPSMLDPSPLALSQLLPLPLPPPLLPPMLLLPLLLLLPSLLLLPQLLMLLPQLLLLLPLLLPPAVTAVAAAAPVSGPVASQFQAQDEFGNVAYGYQNINSAKQERGNALGGVTGSYTYADEAGVHT